MVWGEGWVGIYTLTYFLDLNYRMPALDETTRVILEILELVSDLERQYKMGKKIETPLLFLRKRLEQMNEQAQRLGEKLEWPAPPLPGSPYPPLQDDINFC